MDFDPQVEVAGVIFNQVGGDRHEEMLREICEDLNILCFGCLRKYDVLKEESRHLGLDFSRKEEGSITQTMMKELERQLDIELLLEMTRRSVNVPDKPERRKRALASMNIWIARNKESFSFIYAEHMEWLNDLGKVTYFDPEDNSVVLPDDVDVLYLPGGYPENRARQLSMATNVMNSIKDYIERGGYTLAECGGMMYLTSVLITGTDTRMEYNMAGVLPVKVSAFKGDMRLSLGYRSFELRGLRIRGHEFHYSQVIESDEELTSAAQVYNAKGQPVNTPVYHYKNLIASYTHLYWGETGFMGLFEPVPGNPFLF